MPLFLTEKEYSVVKNLVVEHNDKIVETIPKDNFKYDDESGMFTASFTHGLKSDNIIVNVSPFNIDTTIENFTANVIFNNSNVITVLLKKKCTVTISITKNTFIKGATGSAVTTEDITVLGPGIGSYTSNEIIPAGTDLDNILKRLVQISAPPVYLKPVYSLESSFSGEYESGTIINFINLTPIFIKNDAGNLTNYKLYSFDKNNKDTLLSEGNTIAPYKYDSIITVGEPEDGLSIGFKSKFSYNEGSIKNDSLGNPYPNGHIMDETDKETNKINIRGVRYSFYGSFTFDSMPNTSDLVRGLSNKITDISKGKLVTFETKIGDKGLCICIPKKLGITDITSCIAKSNNQDISGYFKRDKFEIEVEGASPNTKIPYIVFPYKPAKAFVNDDTFTITI